jgi:hypothetical protein
MTKKDIKQMWKRVSQNIQNSTKFSGYIVFVPKSAMKGKEKSKIDNTLYTDLRDEMMYGKD